MSIYYFPGIYPLILVITDELRLRENSYFTQSHAASKWKLGFESRIPKQKCSLHHAMLPWHIGNRETEEVPDCGLADHLPSKLFTDIPFPSMIQKNDFNLHINTFQSPLKCLQNGCSVGM